MTGLHLKYFVLNPTSSDAAFASASRAAMVTFAEVIRNTNKELALDLEKWVDLVNDSPN